jgi:hypothetical protein
MMDWPIGFSVEHKVLHREWDDVLITSEAFFSNIHIFQDDDDFFCGYPTLKFESGSVSVDESFGVRAGRVWTSSFSGGICEWSDNHGQYVKNYHGNSQFLGQLVSVEFTLTEKIKASIAQAKQEQQL